MHFKAKVLAIAVSATLLFSTTAIANSAESNVPLTSLSAKPVVTGSSNNEAAQKKAEGAESKAADARQDMQDKTSKAASDASNQASAAVARDEAKKELKQAEAELKAAAPAETKAAETKLKEAKARSEEASDMAKEISGLAKRTAKIAATAKAKAVKTSKIAKSLAKIGGASDECLDFLEAPSAKRAKKCSVARYVVRFNNGVDPDLQVKGMKSLKISVSDTLDGVFSGAIADLNAGQLRALAASGKIRSIEQDYEIKLESTQENPAWGLDRIDQVGLPLSGSYTNAKTGTGVKVYVVDTGILASHVDFGGRVLTGFTAVNDGRGTEDCNGHGTHVAGTIGGLSYGVAKEANLIPVRVMNCLGTGYLSSVVAGLDWIAQNHTVGASGVVNMSIGGGVSSTLDSAVATLVSRGIPVVVAAGNSAADACQNSPARTPSAITVAASSVTDMFADFSNFGSCVDLIAPGVGVRSAWIGSNTSSEIISGTSMATPHVTGVVAALLTDGYQTPGAIDYLLKQSAAANRISPAPVDTPNLLIQLVTSALVPGELAPIPVEAATVPIAPVLTSTNFLKNTARVNWDISADGGSPLTGHVVRIWERGQLVQAVAISAESTTARIPGLKWGVSYTFTVLASNSIGLSVDSNVLNAYKLKR